MHQTSVPGKCGVSCPSSQGDRYTVWRHRYRTMTHCEGVDFTTCERLDDSLVLSRVQKRDDRAALLNRADFLVQRWRPDFENDVRCAEDLLSVDEGRACSNVMFIEELCFRSGVALDENLLEALLPKQRRILRGQCNAPLVRERFPGHADGKRRVWCPRAIECRFL